MTKKKRPEGWQVVGLLKRIKVTQADIAVEAGVTVQIVNFVIHRKGGIGPEKTEKVWNVLERVLKKAS